MKREDVKKVFPDATDEQLKAIMDLNGSDVEKAKGKVAALEAEIEERKKNIAEMTNTLEELKKSNATNEDYKSQLEAFQKKVKEEADKREADRVAKEEADRLEKRFNAVIGDKKFVHEAIRADYLRKFGEAVKDNENVGKSDVDILTGLTKDDANAFAGSTVVPLVGANKQATPGKTFTSKQEIMQIKDTAERQAAIAQNIELFK